MNKMCFGVFATILSRCKIPSTTQKGLVGNILLSVNPSYDITEDDVAVSALVRGKNNLSDQVIYYIPDSSNMLPKLFKERVIPLLDANKRGNIVLAIKDVLAEDKSILDATEVELVNHITKAEFLEQNCFVLHELLAGLFMYIAYNTENVKSREYVDKISSGYISSFDSRRDTITFVSSYHIANEHEMQTIAADSHIVSLILEAEGTCPMCNKPLTANNCVTFPLDHGEEIILCLDCAAAVRQSPDAMAEAAELKATLRRRSNTVDAIASSRLVDEVKLLIPLIAEVSPQNVILRTTPLRIDKKVPAGNLQRKIKSYVIDGLYDAVNECIELLAAENKLNIRRFSQAIRHMFENASVESDSQSEIFNALVNDIFVKSKQRDYEACELLISYFVQRCEVFNEIAKQDNAV